MGIGSDARCPSSTVESRYCVGRDAELERVRGLVHDAALQEGSALIWLGERGVGKTRFLKECAEIKAAATVVSVHCGSAAPFRPDLASQVAASLRLPSRGRIPRSPALLSALCARTRRRPVAVLVDDLHLADPSEASFLEALIAMTAHQRLVVVGCALDSPATVARRSWNAQLRRLEPIDDPAMELLVRGLTRARKLESDDLHEIVKTAQGNPRYGVELVRRALHSDGASELVPESAGAAVAAIRTALSKLDFAILAACSVIGDTFRGDWLAHVARCSRDDAADALQHASDLGVLAELDGSPNWLRFRQIAVRAALYATIVALKRGFCTNASSNVLSVADCEDDVRRDVLLARHAEIAGDARRAADAYERAAGRLRDGAEFAAAAEHYLRSAGHTPAGSEQWLERVGQTMRYYRNAGDWRRMTRVARSVLEQRNGGTRDEIAETALENLFFAHLNEGDREAAAQTAAQISSLGLPTSEPRARVATLILAYALCYCGQPAEAAALVATVPAKQLEDDEVRLRYFIARAEIGALVAPLQRTLEHVESAVAVGQAMHVIRGTVLCYAAGIEISCRYGNLQAAREYIEKAEAVAVKSAGSINDVWRQILDGRVRVALLSGGLETARELVRANVGWRSSGGHSEAFDAGAAVTIGMRLGDLALVEAFFDPALLEHSLTVRDAESCSLLLFGYADVMLVRGMVKELRRVVERCIEERMIDPYTYLQLCAARFASLEHAARAVAQAETYFKDAIAPSAAGHLALCKATVLRREGQHVAASDLAARAAARFGELGWRLYEAMALELAGNARAASRRCASAAPSPTSRGWRRERRAR